MDLEYFDNAKLWQTFVKSRIYCENKVTDPTFGEQTFTYNRVGMLKHSVTHHGCSDPLISEL